MYIEGRDGFLHGGTSDEIVSGISCLLKVVLGLFIEAYLTKSEWYIMSMEGRGAFLH